MRSTRFIAAFAAVLALFSACRQDEDYLLPAIEVETGTVEFISGSQMSVELLSTRHKIGKIKARAFVDGEVACEAELSCKIVDR